jgi:glycosyltransferase involved in cell wall biosynthesis
MIYESQQKTAPRLVWVCGANIETLLHATRWLEISHELTQSDWHVTLVAAGPKRQQTIRGVNIVHIPMPKIYIFKQIAFHTRLLCLITQRWDEIDVILFESMSAPWVLPLRLVRRLIGKQRPLLVMDTRTLSMIPIDRETWQDRLRRTFSSSMEQLGNRWADGRLAITARMAESLQMPPSKLWGVWPSGVNLEKFSQAQLARTWPFSKEPILLVYIGILNYERNLMTLCHAVEEANTEGMSFNLSIIGYGSEQFELEKFASQTNGRVRVEHSVPHDQIPQLLARFHIGVLPFPDEEKFRVSSPIKLFEYMAGGLPILATRIDCHTDVIQNGRYVFWAESADLSGLLASLHLIWRNRKALSEMGSLAAVAAKARTWHESARKLKSSLESGLNRY